MFDYGNRLRRAPGEWYAYDGHGRRVLSCTPTACDYQQYAANGQLSFHQDNRKALQYTNVYLGGSLVAIREQPTAGGTAVVKYQHTDALGTPIATTDSAGEFVEKSEYEHSGKLVNRPLTDGPAFTGHVQDAATGLTYMQQRYYDPGIGRFLSVDPVTANGNTGANFNRYWYANNNPYKFIDPDGRKVKGPACGQNTSCQLARGAAGGRIQVNLPGSPRSWDKTKGEGAQKTYGPPLKDVVPEEERQEFSRKLMLKHKMIGAENTFYSKTIPVAGCVDQGAPMCSLGGYIFIGGDAFDYSLGDFGSMLFHESNHVIEFRRGGIWTSSGEFMNAVRQTRSYGLQLSHANPFYDQMTPDHFNFWYGKMLENQQRMNDMQGK